MNALLIGTLTLATLGLGGAFAALVTALEHRRRRDADESRAIGPVLLDVRRQLAELAEAERTDTLLEVVARLERLEAGFAAGIDAFSTIDTGAPVAAVRTSNRGADTVSERSQLCADLALCTSNDGNDGRDESEAELAALLAEFEDDESADADTTDVVEAAAAWEDALEDGPQESLDLEVAGVETPAFAAPSDVALEADADPCADADTVADTDADAENMSDALQSNEVDAEDTTAEETAAEPEPESAQAHSHEVASATAVDDDAEPTISGADVSEVEPVDTTAAEHDAASTISAIDVGEVEPVVGPRDLYTSANQRVADDVLEADAELALEPTATDPVESIAAPLPQHQSTSTAAHGSPNSTFEVEPDIAPPAFGDGLSGALDGSSNDDSQLDSLAEDPHHAAPTPSPTHANSRRGPSTAIEAAADELLAALAADCNDAHHTLRRLSIDQIQSLVARLQQPGRERRERRRLLEELRHALSRLKR